MKFLSKVFFIYSTIFLFLGCAKYTHKEDVNSIPGIKLGSLVLPGSEFNYYKQEAYRGDTYLIYFKDEAFFDNNKENVISAINSVLVDPEGGRNFIVNFNEYDSSLFFDFDLTYDYYEIATDDPLVSADGLVNEEHSIYMLRIYNRGMPAE